MPIPSAAFIGNDPAKWHTNIPTYARVRYAEVYPGIDLVYYGKERQLEYDFVLQPGADAARVSLAFEGADTMEVDGATGDLLLRVGRQTIRQQKPVVYQDVEGERRKIDSGEMFERLLQEETIGLHPGDLYLFFTDGISEAMNVEDDCFGEARLGEFVQAHAHLPPDELRERVLREIEAFVGDAPQHDDMTMVLLKIDDRLPVGDAVLSGALAEYR